MCLLNWEGASISEPTHFSERNVNTICEFLQKRDSERLDELENVERERVRTLFLRGELSYLADEGQREHKDDLPQSRTCSNSQHESLLFQTPTRRGRASSRPIMSTNGTHDAKSGATATNVEKITATPSLRTLTGTSDIKNALSPVGKKFPFISTLRIERGIGSRSISMDELTTPTRDNSIIEKMSNESEFGGVSESEEKVSKPTNSSEFSNQTSKESKWTKFQHLQKLFQTEVC